MPPPCHSPHLPMPKDVQVAMVGQCFKKMEMIAVKKSANWEREKNQKKSMETLKKRLNTEKWRFRLKYSTGSPRLTTVIRSWDAV